MYFLLSHFYIANHCRGSTDGAVVGAGSIPGLGVICGLSLSLVLVLASEGFSPVTPVFPSPQKPTFPNSNSIWIIVKHFNHEPLAREIAQAFPVLLIFGKLIYTFPTHSEKTKFPLPCFCTSSRSRFLLTKCPSFTVHFHACSPKAASWRGASFGSVRCT